MNLNNANGIITIAPGEIDKSAVGRVVFWSAGGDVALPALVAALASAGSKAIPPEPVSPKVALHRAVEAVADQVGCDALLLEAPPADDPKKQRKRGDWAIVRKPTQRTGATGDEVAYPIVASARVNGTILHVDAPSPFAGVELLHTTYEAARNVLASNDVGTWLCAKLRALDALPLKPNGGVYFVPKDRVPQWDLLVSALAKVSTCTVHGIPAMRTQDAVDAILAAITAETRSECTKLAEDIASIGGRALETREGETNKLLSRLERYEGLLGTRLDDLRAAIDETRSAVATARMALSADEG